MILEYELRCMYQDEGMSQRDIAEYTGFSHSAVCKWMKLYGISSRTISETQLGNCVKLSKNELEEMYLDKRMSSYKIAGESGVSHVTVLRWLKEYGIASRTLSEASIGTQYGENNPSWKGGISPNLYCYKFNKRFKESVRIRDNHICQLCGCEQNGRKLDVHHVHYKKSDCYPDVVALCRSCNAKVNTNRDYWENYFELMLIDRGLYCWSLSNID